MFIYEGRLGGFLPIYSKYGYKSTSFLMTLFKSILVVLQHTMANEICMHSQAMVCEPKQLVNLVLVTWSFPLADILSLSCI